MVKTIKRYWRKLNAYNNINSSAVCVLLSDLLFIKEVYLYKKTFMDMIRDKRLN